MPGHVLPNSADPVLTPEAAGEGPGLLGQAFGKPPWGRADAALEIARPVGRGASVPPGLDAIWPRPEMTGAVSAALASNGGEPHPHAARSAGPGGFRTPKGRGQAPIHGSSSEAR
jgi:hypothetical protein